MTINIEYYNKRKNFHHEEMRKFEVIAPLWWDPEGEFQSLHRINLLRINYIIERIGGIFGKSVLDVGCGGGILAESMACEGAKVTGIDMGTEQLKIARIHAIENRLKIHYIQETVESHAKKKNSYDVITCMEMLEHVPDQQSVVQACAALMKPGGHVFLSTINRNEKSWFLVVIGAEYIFHILPNGTHNHNKFIRPSELINWIDNTLLYEQHMIGFYYNKITNHFQLGHNVDMNYIMHATFNSSNFQKILFNKNTYV